MGDRVLNVASKLNEVVGCALIQYDQCPYKKRRLGLQEEIQFSSVTQLCPTLCDPMDCSTPGLPVQHQLLEFTQTHVH